MAARPGALRPRTPAGYLKTENGSFRSLLAWGQRRATAQRTGKQRCQVGDLFAHVDRREHEFDGPFGGQTFGFQRVGKAKATNRQVGARGAHAVELQVNVLAFGDHRAGGDPHVFEKLALEMRRLHISAESMVGGHIPAAVALIGEEWHSDRIDILESTIAISRMKNLLRELGRTWSADAANPHMAGSVLMVMPDTERHTIGAMIATTQMRHMGVSVAVQLLSSSATLADLLRLRQFDAVFLPVGNFDSIDACRKLVSTARSVVGTTVRFAVGGAVPVDPEDLRRITGADFATLDVSVALREFGLMKTATPVE